MKGLPKVHKDLDGLDIQINEFGEIISSYDVKDINKFLNKNVEDKKLRDRDDITDEGDYQNTFKEYGRYIKESAKPEDSDSEDDSLEDSAEEEEDDEDKYLSGDDDDIEEEEE